MDTKLEIKNVADHIIAIANAKNVLIQNIMDLADREVDGTPQCQYHMTSYLFSVVC